MVFLLLLTSHFAKAMAGCGCEHPLPLPAAVIPSVIYPGMPVKLYSDNFVPGENYIVWFGAVKVQATADMDRESKRRIKVTLLHWSLPFGPTMINVRDSSHNSVLSIPSSDFTVIPPPYTLPSRGENQYHYQKLTVGADGTLYCALNMEWVRQAVHIEGQLLGYPLRIDDFTVLNVQGYNMETVGLWRIDPTGSDKSDEILYDRHSFELYYQDHAERRPHEVDSADPDYHLDGTRHIDHEHLILAISGHLGRTTTPLPPGPTRELKVEFRLHLE